MKKDCGETPACDVDRSRLYLRHSRATCAQTSDALDWVLRPNARQEPRELHSFRYGDDPHPATTPVTLASIPEACGITAADRERRCPRRSGQPARAEFPGSGNELHRRCWTAHSAPNGGFRTFPLHRSISDQIQGEFELTPNFSYFDGESHDEDYLDWEQEVDDFFYIVCVPPERQVRVVVRKLTGRAAVWWSHLIQARHLEGRGDVKTWLKMKRLLRGQFLTLDFEVLLDHPPHTCLQNFHSMKMLDGCKQPEDVRKTNKDAHTHFDVVFSMFGGEPGSVVASGHAFFQKKKKEYATVTESPKGLKHRNLSISTLTADVSLQSEMEDDATLADIGEGGNTNEEAIVSSLAGSYAFENVEEQIQVAIGASSFESLTEAKEEKESLLFEDVGLEKGSPDTTGVGDDKTYATSRVSTKGKVSLNTEEVKSQESSEVFLKYGSPFRLIQDYTSDDSDEQFRSDNDEDFHSESPPPTTIGMLVREAIPQGTDRSTCKLSQLISFICRVDTLSKILEPEIHIVENLSNDGKDTSRPFEFDILEGRKAVADQETVELHSKQIIMEKQASDDETNNHRDLRIYLHFSEPIFNPSRQVLNLLHASSGLLLPLNTSTHGERRWGYEITRLSSMDVITIKGATNSIHNKQGTVVAGRIISQIRERLKLSGVMEPYYARNEKLKGKSLAESIVTSFLDALKPSLKFNTDMRYKKIGVIGTLKIVSTLGDVNVTSNFLPSQKSNSNYALELLQMSLESCKLVLLTLILLRDKLLALLEGWALKLEIIEWVGKHVSEFEPMFLSDFEEGQLPLSSLHDGIEGELWIRLDGEASSKVLKILPLLSSFLLNFEVMPRTYGVSKLDELTFPPKPGW